jgi:glycosyltransferase involved in cell wall biosynthesis
MRLEVNIKKRNKIMVSVLLPIYNGEKYIKQSLTSVLNQTFQDFEILIGFNGTTDNSKQIVNYVLFEGINDPELLYTIQNKVRIFDYGDDKGKAKTLNKLIKEARFDIIALQDDDDIWHPNKLEKQVSMIGEFDVVGTFLSYINHNGLLTNRLPLEVEDFNIKYKSLERGINNVANTSAIFKKSVAFEINGWREDIDGIEDFDFWLRLMRINKKFGNVPEFLLFHRMHNNSNFNTKKYDIKSIL